MTPRRDAGEARDAGRRAGSAPPAVELVVKRSARRTRTISWRLENRPEGVRVLLEIPAALTREQEAEWRARVEQQVRERLARLQQRGDGDLLTRARALARQYLPGPLPLRSAAWSERQQQRWGSCSPDVGAVRLSSRLRALPDWVVDYVLVHELAHLRVPDHSAEFWKLVSRYPLAERARGFLMGYEHCGGRPAADDDVVAGAGDPAED